MRSLVRLVSIAVFVAGLGSAPGFAAGVETPAVTPPPNAATAAPPAVAADEAAWQGVITGQIEAFRRADAPTALSYASATFRQNFKDPSTFLVSVAAAGYGPIFTSVSHSFGKFTQSGPMTVVQVVDFVGPKQELYEAIYGLAKEPDGWRIEGVQLMQQPGLGV